MRYRLYGRVDRGKTDAIDIRKHVEEHPRNFLPYITSMFLLSTATIGSKTHIHIRTRSYHQLTNLNRGNFDLFSSVQIGRIFESSPNERMDGPINRNEQK